MISELAWPERIWLTMLSALLVGMAKPIVAVLERKPCVWPAVTIPMTWPVAVELRHFFASGA